MTRTLPSSAPSTARALALVGLLAAILAAMGCAGSPESTSTADDGAATAASEAIEQAIAGDHRSEANVARDGARHPLETLTFFGLESDMTVLEILPGGGLYYGEILAPVLRERGRYVMADYDVSLPDQPEYRYRGHERILARFAEAPDTWGEPAFAKLSPPDSVDLGEPGSVDMVLTFRNTHGWVRDGVADEIYAAFFEVLAPGGVLGVVQHRASEKTDREAFTGYVAEEQVIALATAAGFVLEARSEVNANPKDEADYPGGVWTLPPTLRLKDEDRDRYLAIGESDRMTLRFRKPS